MDNTNVNTSVSWWEAHKPTKRRIVQLYSALLYNAHLRGFAEGTIFTGKTKAVCVPGFNCYSCPGAIGACPLGSLQNALGSLNKHIGFYVFGIIILYGMLLGRTICGWICPLGMLQELVHKLPTPKFKKSKFTRALTYLKYVILVVFACCIPIYYGLSKDIQVPGFCKFICPAGTFEGAMGMLPKNIPFLSMLGPVFTRKFVIMVLVILTCIFCYRAFCRFLCPLGAIYGFFNKLSVIGVKVDSGKCVNCGICVKKCKMDVKHVGDRECIYCGQCIQSCPKSAIALKAGNHTLVERKNNKTENAGVSDSEKKRKSYKKICMAVLGVLLAFALIWCNFLDPTVRVRSSQSADSDAAGTVETTGTADMADAYKSDAPVGCEAGNQLAEFEAVCLDGSTFKLSDTKGKIVLINLWATYCGPCVHEMPQIVEFSHKHEGDVEILAVHTNLVTEDVNAYLSDKGWDIKFAVDDEDETIFKTVNGSLSLPQTIVLNRKGEVIFNRVGSITPELLEGLYEKADSE